MVRSYRVATWVGLGALVLLCAAFMTMRARTRPGNGSGGTAVSVPDVAEVHGQVMPWPPAGRDPRSAVASEGLPRLLGPWLEDLIAKHRERWESGTHLLGQFQIETRLLYREARLAAQAFPELTEKSFTPVACNGAGVWVDRQFAISTLGHVAKAGRVSAANTLVSLLGDPDERVRDDALSALATSDDTGARKELYWTACHQGSVAALDIVSAFPDEGSIQEMRGLVAQGKNPYAKGALEKMELLVADDWEERLKSVLMDQHLLRESTLWWACRVARLRKSQALLDVMRTRLDDGILESRKQWNAASVAKKNAPFEALYGSSAAFADTTKDSYHDYILLSYWMAGGKVTDLEKARLRTFGYCDDPKQRLAEIMAEK